MGSRPQFWINHLRRIDAEGISIASYARREQLSVHSLYSARHQLRKSQSVKKPATRKQAPASSAAQPFVAVKLPKPRQEPTRQNAADTACLVEIGGIELKLNTLPDASWLAKLSFALEQRRR